MTDWEIEFAKESLLRESADLAHDAMLAREVAAREASHEALDARVRALDDRVAELAGLRARLDDLESQLLALAEEALRRRQQVEEGAETFHRLTRRGPWVAVREHVVDLRDGDRVLRVPAWLVTDGQRYWSVPAAVLTTLRPMTPARPRGVLRGVAAGAFLVVGRLLGRVGGLCYRREPARSRARANECRSPSTASR